MGRRIEVRAEVSGWQLIEGLRRLILDSEDFRATAWSLDDAETLERCAAAIRRGYGPDRTAVGPADDPLVRRVAELFDRREERVRAEGNGVPEVSAPKRRGRKKEEG